MRQFKLHINLENDAFFPDPEEEIARILIKLATKLIDHRAGNLTHYQNILDVNGNIVGKYAIKQED